MLRNVSFSCNITVTSHYGILCHFISRQVGPCFVNLFLHAITSCPSDVYRNHGVLPIRYVESRNTGATYDNCISTRPSGVTTRRAVVIAGNDVTVLPFRKSGLQGLRDGEILVVDEDERPVSPSESNRLESVIPPVGYWVANREVVESDHVIHLPPAMFTDPLTVEAFDVLCRSSSVRWWSDPVVRVLAIDDVPRPVVAAHQSDVAVVPSQLKGSRYLVHVRLEKGKDC